MKVIENKFLKLFLLLLTYINCFSFDINWNEYILPSISAAMTGISLSKFNNDKVVSLLGAAIAFGFTKYWQDYFVEQYSIMKEIYELEEASYEEERFVPEQEVNLQIKVGTSVFKSDGTERLFGGSLFINVEKLFAVWDGIGVDKDFQNLCKSILEQEFIPYLQSNQMKNFIIDECKRTSASIREREQGVASEFTMIKFINNRQILIANLGDSKALLFSSKNGSVSRFSTTNKNFYDTDPEIKIHNINESDDFIILANSNFWKHVDDKEAINNVLLSSKTSCSYHIAAKNLAKLAWEKGNSSGQCDNITVLIIFLK